MLDIHVHVLAYEAAVVDLDILILIFVTGQSIYEEIVIVTDH